MRYALLLLPLLFLSALPYFQANKPIPPGLRDGDRAVQNGEVMEPPREFHAKSVNLDAMKAEAMELRKLADAIPADADEIAKGALPKDMSENLKRIEKLAKHLRSEVTP